MEGQYCITCYEPIGDGEAVEVPTPSFITELEKLTIDATREKVLRYILAYEKNNDIDYLRDKSRTGIVGWEAQTIGLPSQKLKPLLNARLVGITFSSNSSTDFALADRRLLESLLKDNATTSRTMTEQEFEFFDDLFACITGYDDVKDEVRFTLREGRRSHYLMIGPPATVKSLFLMGLGRINGAYQATGSTVTGPGLTDALLTYRPKTLILDELDKVKMDATAVLLSVMESGDILQTKHRKHGIQRIKLNVFAAANRDSGLAPELISRFDTKLYFRRYSFEDFITICKGYLPRYENLSIEIAEYIGRQTWHQLDRDVRTARGMARRLREATTTDVDRVVRFLRKYSKLEADTSVCRS
jgi:Holliday junction resolvasome RuvABC ATP-dependent DNA helicase subunit